jgi:hypothetical protein
VQRVCQRLDPFIGSSEFQAEPFRFQAKSFRRLIEHSRARIDCRSQKVTGREARRARDVLFDFRAGTFSSGVLIDENEVTDLN